MKAIEFKSRMKNKSIKVPEKLVSVFNKDKDIRVIVLFEENDNQEESDFKSLVQEQFLAGYSDSDSIYDNY